MVFYPDNATVPQAVLAVLPEVGAPSSAMEAARAALI